MQFRLSPGLLNGTWSHDNVSKVASLSLKFAGILSPVQLSLEGDVPVILANGHRSVFGYRELPESQRPSEADEPAESVVAFVNCLRENPEGYIKTAALDDADGVEISWRDVRHEVVGVLRFCIHNPRS